MNAGDVLVHSNEACNGGPGGFEIYDVDDPARGIYKVPNDPFFYASDRNGGLYVLKMKGADSGK